MSTTVTVTDMSCDGCEDIVEGAVEDVAGVESATADREAETVTVDGDASVEAIMEAIDFAGYSPQRVDEGTDEADQSSDEDDADSAEAKDAAVDTEQSDEDDDS